MRYLYRLEQLRSQLIRAVANLQTEVIDGGVCKHYDACATCA